MAKKVVIVITGVPGTGKTRIVELLKKKIKGAETIRATDVINRKKLFSSYGRDGSKIVKMAALSRAINKELSNSKASVVILEGHILCDIKVKGAKAVILREHLNTIKKRLLARGYGKDKVRANLVSEATDYCGAHAARNYGEVFEMFSGSKTTLPSLIRMARGGRIKKQSIDLLEELRRIIKEDRDLVL
jgi:broad-specificity NMP kinase